MSNPFNSAFSPASIKPQEYRIKIKTKITLHPKKQNKKQEQINNNTEAIRNADCVRLYISYGFESCKMDFQFKIDGEFTENYSESGTYELGPTSMSS